MQQFVCVRIPQANTIDLTRFQFDYDLTFAVFFMNADGTIYGRFGTRSSRQDATHDISLEALAEALSGALKLHANYPQNKSVLDGKQAVASPYRTPDDIPSLRGKYEPVLEYSGNVVRSCMHCHQIRDAERLAFRNELKPIPDKLLFPYPMPAVIGLQLDSHERAKVTDVGQGSPAARADFQVGDEIITLQDQAILSIADIQWVLQNADEPDELRAMVRRRGEPMNLTISLSRGWRRATDISWRVSSWDLRRMGTGGLLLQQLSAEDRRKNDLNGQRLALQVEHVGQHGDHAVAKRAGFQKGDIIIAFNGRTEPMTESQLLGYAVQNTIRGAKVPVRVLRNGKPIELQLRMQ